MYADCALFVVILRKCKAYRYMYIVTIVVVIDQILFGLFLVKIECGEGISDYGDIFPQHMSFHTLFVFI